jgi:NitT/TauT family transport system ATP-binding protein
MLKIESLEMRFGGENKLEVLKNISFSAKPGEFVCILGPSGCGKTIFLYLVAGFLRPTSGSIVFEGYSVKKPGADRVMLFQEYALFPWMTVEQNILFGLEKSDLSGKAKKGLVEKYLEIIGLRRYKNWYPFALSGGMKQRVALARALISNPKMLLLDEPFAALDPQYRKYLRENLEKLWQDDPKTMLFVTHSINEAVYLADTIHLFSNIPASIEKTYRVDLPRPRDPYSAEFLALAKKIEKDVRSEFDQYLKKYPSIETAFEKILRNN